VCVALFYQPDIGESLRSRGFLVSTDFRQPGVAGSSTSTLTTSLAIPWARKKSKTRRTGASVDTRESARVFRNERAGASNQVFLQNCMCVRVLTNKNDSEPCLYALCDIFCFCFVLSPHNSRAYYIRSGYRWCAVTRKPRLDTFFLSFSTQS